MCQLKPEDRIAHLMDSYLGGRFATEISHYLGLREPFVSLSLFLGDNIGRHKPKIL